MKKEEIHLMKMKEKLFTEKLILSVLAAQYAVPNEYDKMIGSIGAKGTNAYTSSERTVYINEIPSNEFEKWLSIELKDLAN